MSHKVFVYGSLKKGFHNHPIIEKSKFLGNFKTENEFTMVSLGAFPAITQGDSQISGEVYEVDDNTFKSLDRLEGYPNFYSRKIINLPNIGSSWIYFIPELQVHKYPLVVDGNWK